MPSPHIAALQGLKEARSGLLSRVAKLEEQRGALLQQVAALETSILVLAPSEQTKPLLDYRTPNENLTSELKRNVLRTLRIAGRALSAREIANTLISQHNLDVADAAQTTILKQRIGCCLRKMRLKGEVRSRDNGRWPEWEIVPLEELLTRVEQAEAA